VVNGSAVVQRGDNNPKAPVPDPAPHEPLVI